MQKFHKILLSVVVPTCIAIFAVAFSVVGSTTIGTDITTGGNLTVTGTSTFTGEATFESNCIDVDGFNYCGASNNPPFDCTASDEPGQFFDIDTTVLCFCDGIGSAWASIDAAAGGCASVDS
ncbi:MAG: hypothetical protein KBD16_01830 [Candidatus Pacebacteria bacterium]|nr:hypothetical protein [Candidatus Paceibacterota bacterium]